MPSFFYKCSNNATATTAMRKLAVSLADSTDLRIILSVLYIIVEVIRSVSEEDSPEWHQVAETFRHDISKIFNFFNRP